MYTATKRITRPTHCTSLIFSSNSTRLKAMGITDAFDEEKADFGLLSDSEVNISKIQQANIFSIDENGTSIGSNSENNNITRTLGSWNIFFNRPFLFFVREVKTNTILFAGKVAKM